MKVSAASHTMETFPIPNHHFPILKARCKVRGKSSNNRHMQYAVIELLIEATGVTNGIQYNFFFIN